MRHPNLKTRSSGIGRACQRHAQVVPKLILFSCLLFSFAGCGSLGHKLTFLRPAIGPNDEYVKSLQAKYKNPQAVEDFYRGATSSPLKSRRNQIVNELLFLINDYYSAYELSWYATATGHSFLSDLTTLGLDTATAAVGGAELKTMLAAISTGVGGQKIAVQRDFFQNQNIALIIKNMRAARADVLVKIRAKTPKSTDEYPLEDALLDLQEYFAAGTVIGGIQHADDTAALQKIIAEDAASQNARVDKLAALRTAQDKPKSSPSPKPQQASTEE
jgi:hypothetical protein